MVMLREDGIPIAGAVDFGSVMVMESSVDPKDECPNEANALLVGSDCFPRIVSTRDGLLLQLVSL